MDHSLLFDGDADRNGLVQSNTSQGPGHSLAESTSESISEYLYQLNLNKTMFKTRLTTMG